MWVKYLGQKKFRQFFFGVNKNVGQKDLGQKKRVGFTQGGGYMTPPPENSRVKIVFGCC